MECEVTLLAGVSRGERRDSNPRPPGPQPGALPTELRPPSRGQFSGALGSVASKLLALTFDDGPDPRGTPAVLEALEEAEVTATFFVLAERVERHPELLERVVLAGHDVQIHGYEHLRHPYTPREDVENDIDRALSVVPGDEVADPVGTPRAAYTREVARERSLTIVGWDADTHDWRGDSAEAMLAQLRLEPGGIVLAHDGVGAGARRETAIETARLVGPLVRRGPRARARARAARGRRGRRPSPSATRTSRRVSSLFGRDRGERRAPRRATPSSRPPRWPR